MRAKKRLIHCMCCMLFFVGDVLASLPLEFEKMPLSDVVTMFSELAGISVSIPSGVDPIVTIKGQAADYDDAIAQIASAAGLRSIQTDAGYRLESEKRSIGVAVIDLKHREAQQVLDLIQESKSQFDPSLSVIGDPETNRLILRGDSADLASIKDLVSVLDVEVKQILIEAKLVSQDMDKRRDLGIRWSFATGDSGRSGAQGQTQGLGDNAGGSALSLAFVSDPKLLALELQALESSGVGEVISEPRIVTTNRRAATIRQGQQLPFVTVDEDGRSSTEFKDAVLELKVTPILRDDGRIEMTLDIRQDQVSQLVTAQGPVIETRELNTRVTVDPDETLVLGGIYESKEENITVNVPGLSSIPVLGHAFRSTQRRAFKSELLIFITPRVL